MAQVINMADLPNIEGPKLAFGMPQSAGDVFLCTAIVNYLRGTYPKHNIIFLTQERYFDVLKDNPDIDYLLDCAHLILDQMFHTFEGHSNKKGLVDIIYLPYLATQKHGNYIHNMQDIISIHINTPCLHQPYYVDTVDDCKVEVW